MNSPWPEIGGHFQFSNLDATYDLTCILSRILILFTIGYLLVLLTFIELLMNHGSGTGVQGMSTAANVT